MQNLLLKDIGTIIELKVRRGILKSNATLSTPNNCCETRSDNLLSLRGYNSCDIALQVVDTGHQL